MGTVFSSYALCANQAVGQRTMSPQRDEMSLVKTNETTTATPVAAAIATYGAYFIGVPLYNKVLSLVETSMGGGKGQGGMVHKFRTFDWKKIKIVGT